MNLQPLRLSSRSFKPLNKNKPKKGAKKDEPNRTRKSRDQISELMKLYHATKGEPNRNQIQHISEKLVLSENQVYKWFWDTKQKHDKNNADLLAMEGQNFRGAFVVNNTFNIEHKDGSGNPLTP